LKELLVKENNETLQHCTKKKNEHITKPFSRAIRKGMNIRIVVWAFKKDVF
jgi:HKD family nuclease